MIRSVAFGIALGLAASGLAISGSAFAQSSEDEMACKDDAFRVCGDTIPDRERTFQCMIANREMLSPQCRAVVARALPPEPAPKKVGKRPKKSPTQGQGPINLSPTAAR
jgi:hypothetical protein